MYLKNSLKNEKHDIQISINKALLRAQVHERAGQQG